MESVPVKPFTLDTVMCNYFLLPKAVLMLELPKSAMVLYSILLSRATLSRRNGYADDLGRIYVIYTLEDLAKDLCIGLTSVKRQLQNLQDAGLIFRLRPVGNRANRIYVNLPADSVLDHPSVQNGPSDSPKTTPSTDRRETPNKITRYTDRNKMIYLTYEEESL